MKRLLLSFQIFILGIFISCNGDIGNGGGDGEYPPDFFYSFVDENGQDIFESSSYDKDSVYYQVKIPDGTSSSVRYNPPTPNKKNGLTVLGPIGNNVLSGGIAESGTIFTTTHLYFFSNGDIDTLYTVVNCQESCRYDDKTMQIYFNDRLIHDFDFRDKDSELIQRMLDNNYRPYGGDTVVFVILKVL